MVLGEIFLKLHLSKTIKKKSITISEKNHRVLILFNKQDSINSKKYFLNLLTLEDLLKLSESGNIIDTCYPNIVFRILIEYDENCFTYPNNDLNFIAIVTNCISAVNTEIPFLDLAKEFAFIELSNDINSLVTVKQREQLLFHIISEHLTNIADTLMPEQLMEYFVKVVMLSEGDHYRVAVHKLFLNFLNTQDITWLLGTIGYLPKNIKVGKNKTNLYTKVHLIPFFKYYCQKQNIPHDSFFEIYFSLMTTEELITIPNNYLDSVATTIINNPTNIINYGEEPVILLQHIFRSYSKKFTTDHITLMCAALNKKQAFDLCKVWVLEFEKTLDYANLATIFGTDKNNNMWNLGILKNCKNAKEANVIFEIAMKNNIPEEVMLNFLLKHVKILNWVDKKRGISYLNNSDNKRKYIDALKKTTTESGTITFQSSAVTISTRTFYDLKWQEHLEEIESKDKIIDQEDICIICLTNKKIVALIPCGHLRLCATCIFEMLRQEKFLCPQCRSKSTNILIVY